MARPADTKIRRPLFLRIVSALILAPLVLASVWAGTAYFAAVVAVFAVVLAIEWQQLCCEGEFRLVGLAMIVVVVLPILATLMDWLAVASLCLAAGVVLIEILARFSKRHPNWWLGVGCLYVGFPCASLIWIHATEPSGAALMYWLLAVVWVTDSGAYAAGRILGGPKLAPAISPNKTWSGAIGGLCGALVVGLVTLEIIDSVHLLGLIAVSIVTSIASQIGDLFESGVKRYFGVKDTGRIIPGHGGALDRVDGLLIAAPVAAGFVLLQQVGCWKWT